MALWIDVIERAQSFGPSQGTLLRFGPLRTANSGGSFFDYLVINLQSRNYTWGINVRNRSKRPPPGVPMGSQRSLRATLRSSQPIGWQCTGQRHRQSVSDALRAIRAAEAGGPPASGARADGRLELLDVHGRFVGSLGDGGGVLHLLRSGGAPSSSPNSLTAFPESFPRCDHEIASSTDEPELPRTETPRPLSADASSTYDDFEPLDSPPIHDNPHFGHDGGNANRQCSTHSRPPPLMLLNALPQPPHKTSASTSAM